MKTFRGLFASLCLLAACTFFVPAQEPPSASPSRDIGPKPAIVPATKGAAPRFFGGKPPLSGTQYVFVDGMVNRPGFYEWREELTLEEVLKAAGLNRLSGFALLPQRRKCPSIDTRDLAKPEKRVLLRSGEAVEVREFCIF